MAQLPAPWQNMDIGNVDKPGYATYADGVFTIAGSGSVWDTDAFQYVYQSISGDTVELTAHLDSYDTSIYEWTKVGLMFRASDDPFARNIFLFSASGYGICMQGRLEDYGQPVWGATYGGDAYPQWMKLKKEGNMVIGFASSDGAVWDTVRALEINLDGDFLIGMAVTSTWPDTLVEANFSSVEVYPAAQTGLPAPWMNADIGNVDKPGAADYADGVFTVSGSGAVWDTDAFHYVYQKVSDTNIEFTARLDNYDTGIYEWTKVGIMLRQSDDPFSKNVFLFSAPGYGVCMQGRQEDYGQPVWWATYGGDAYPAWMRFVKEGDSVAAYTSTDGSVWNLVRKIEFTVSGEYLAGLAVTSTWPDTLCTAQFSNVTISATALEDWKAAPVAQTLELVQNYPNPFNPTTTISFRINRQSQVTVKVYDILGHEVAELLNRRLSPAEYKINFNAANLSSGIYFYEVQAGKEHFTGKMVLMK